MRERLFSKNRSNKIAPADVKPKAQSNNYIDPEPKQRDTYYLCMPGNADFNMENGLIDFAAKINQERQEVIAITDEIASAATGLRKYQLDLLANFDNLPLVKVIERNMLRITQAIIQLETDLAYIQRKAAFHFTLGQFYETPESALKAALVQYPAHTLSIVKVSVDEKDMRLDHLGDKEIARPNLIKIVESIKSVSHLETKKLLGIRDDLVKQKISGKKLIQQVEEKTNQVIIEMLANADEYEKKIIAIAKPSAHAKKYSNSLSLPSIPEEDEKEYFKLVKVDDKISLGFQKKEAPQHPVEANMSQPGRRR